MSCKPQLTSFRCVDVDAISDGSFPAITSNWTASTHCMTLKPVLRANFFILVVLIFLDVSFSRFTSWSTVVGKAK